MNRAVLALLASCVLMLVGTTCALALLGKIDSEVIVTLTATLIAALAPSPIQPLLERLMPTTPPQAPGGGDEPA